MAHLIGSWAPGQELRYHSSVFQALETGRPLILVMESGVYPIQGGFQRLLQEVSKPGVSMAYSWYDTRSKTAKPPAYNGDFTERFPAGPLRAYNRERLLNLDIEKFPRAWEYHARLVLEEKGHKPVLIEESLYFYAPEIGPRPDLARFVLKEPGAPANPFADSFSYLRYDPETEQEIKQAFFAMLKRRGAFLDERVKPHREFPGGKGDYPVMATVLIPVRNRARFIGQAIDSALNQEFDDYEVIVVDNDSEDETREVVRSFKDQRVRLIENPMGSIAFALNTGLKHARGKYIIQLDSDDALAPDAIASMVREMENDPGAGLAISYYQLCDENMRPLKNGVVKHLEYDRNNILRCEGAGAVRCWRKAVLDEIHGFNEKFGNYGEDYDAVLKVSERYRVNRVHKVLYFYRQHTGGQDSVQSPEQRHQAKTQIRIEALARRQELLKKIEILGDTGSSI